MAIKIDKPIVSASVVEKSTAKQPPAMLKRPSELHGKTYKLRDHYREISLYATINNHEGKPVELFANSKHSECDQWVQLSTLLISHIFQSNIPLSPKDVVRLMKEVRSEYPYPSRELGRQVNSMVQELGFILEQHIDEMSNPAETIQPLTNKKPVTGEECPKCHEMTLIKMDGCMTCTSCGESKCG